MGDGYAKDHELIEVKSLSRNALHEIVLNNSASTTSAGKKCSASLLKDKYFTL